MKCEITTSCSCTVVCVCSFLVKHQLYLHLLLWLSLSHLCVCCSYKELSNLSDPVHMCYIHDTAHCQWGDSPGTTMCREFTLPLSSSLCAGILALNTQTCMRKGFRSNMGNNWNTGWYFTYDCASEVIWRNPGGFWSSDGTEITEQSVWTPSTVKVDRQMFSEGCFIHSTSLYTAYIDFSAACVWSM